MQVMDSEGPCTSTSMPVSSPILRPTRDHLRRQQFIFHGNRAFPTTVSGPSASQGNGCLESPVAEQCLTTLILETTAGLPT